MTTWQVPGQILRVVDADTLAVNLDLGWHITMAAKVRLASCNAPELSTAAGRAAKQFVERMLCDENGDFLPITVLSHSLDKYGRVLGTIVYSSRTTGVPCDLTTTLLAAGHAVPA